MRDNVFNDVGSGSDYIASNGWIIRVRRIGKDEDGSDRVLCHAPIPTFVWRG